MVKLGRTHLWYFLLPSNDVNVIETPDNSSFIISIERALENNPLASSMIVYFFVCKKRLG